MSRTRDDQVSTVSRRFEFAQADLGGYFHSGDSGHEQAVLGVSKLPQRLVWHPLGLAKQPHKDMSVNQVSLPRGQAPTRAGARRRSPARTLTPKARSRGGVTAVSSATGLPARAMTIRSPRSTRTRRQPTLGLMYVHCHRHRAADSNSQHAMQPDPTRDGGAALPANIFYRWMAAMATTRRLESSKCRGLSISMVLQGSANQRLPRCTWTITSVCSTWTSTNSALSSEAGRATSRKPVSSSGLSPSAWPLPIWARDTTLSCRSTSAG